MNVYKKITIIMFLWFFSCMSEPMSYESQDIEIKDENIDWFYDIDTEKLFLQINLSNIEPELIKHLLVKLSPLQSDFQELFDDGQGDDMIAGNQIYSVIIDNVLFEDNYILNTKLNLNDDIMQESEYSIDFNAPTIIDDVIYPIIPLQHILDEDDYTLFNIILAVDDQDGREDIEYVRFYIKKIDFFNGELVDNECDYDLVQENEYQWDPSWEMSYVGENTSGQYIYQTAIPMLSMSACGGFGQVQFKFIVQDQQGFQDTLEIDDVIEICPGVCE